MSFNTNANSTNKQIGFFNPKPPPKESCFSRRKNWVPYFNSQFLPRTGLADWLSFALPSEAEAAELPLTRLRRGKPLLANRQAQFGQNPDALVLRRPLGFRPLAEGLPSASRCQGGVSPLRKVCWSSLRDDNQFSVDFAEGWRLAFSLPLGFKAFRSLALRPNSPQVHNFLQNVQT